MKKFITQNLRNLKNSQKNNVRIFLNFFATAKLFGAIFLISFCFFAPQQASAKTDFLATYKTDLEAVEAYLNSITNFSAKFVQKSSNGIVEGKFYLSRPGKMRVEYVNEPKILIVVNGSVLSYKDIELDEVSNLSTNTTPASFLTRPNISFAAKDVEITNVVKNNESITISLIKKIALKQENLLLPLKPTLL